MISDRQRADSIKRLRLADMLHKPFPLMALRELILQAAHDIVALEKDDLMKHPHEESVGTLEQTAGASIGNGQIGAPGQAEERQGAARTGSVRDTARRTDGDGMRGKGERVVDVQSYDALEGDFRAHHQTNPARRRGPYEHYRLVYRYGYDLASDTRYHSAAWSDVERDARPRWEERNPGTWEEFKETIRYAWDKTRGRR